MNKDSDGLERGERRADWSLISLGTAAAVVIFTALSAVFGTVLAAFAAGCAAVYLASYGNNPILLAVSAAAGFGIIYLKSTDLLLASYGAAALAIAALSVFLFRKLSMRFFKSTVTFGAAALLIGAALILVHVYRTYGDVISGTAKAASDFYASVKSGIKNMLAQGNNALTMSDDDIEGALSFTATILPGLAALFAELLGGAVYLIARFFFSSMGCERTDRKDGKEYAIPSSIPVFLAVSLILSLVFSISPKTEVPWLAAINIFIALAFYTMIDGIIRFIQKIKNPKTVELPDGRVLKRPPFLMISLLALSALYSIFLTPAIFIIYSVIGTVSDAIKQRKS